MKKALLPILVSGLLFFPIGVVVGETQSDSTENKASESEHDHAAGTDPEHDHDEHGNPVTTETHNSHSHETFDASDLNELPAISNLSVQKDKKSGWNLTFDVENFTFTPKNVNSDHVDNEGHAHIMVNGERLARIYSNSFHIEELAFDTSSVVVTLNTNTHEVYTVDGESVSAQAQVFNKN